MNSRSRPAILCAAATMFTGALSCAAAESSDLKAEAQNLVGSWVLSYAAKDANLNRVLDPGEQQPPGTSKDWKSALGYMAFAADGDVIIDFNLQHHGHYELLEQQPRDKLAIRMDDKDLGTYRFLIIEASRAQLVLEDRVGSFMVYRRSDSQGR